MARDIFNKSGERLFCGKCNSKLIKDPHVSGDYYKMPSGDIILMSYCSNPECGLMYPPLTDTNEDYLSNNMKKKLLHRVFTVNQLGYVKKRSIIDEAKGVHSLFEFITLIRRHTDLSPDKILPHCM